MEQVCIGLGSNVGDRERALERALGALAERGLTLSARRSLTLSALQTRCPDTARVLPFAAAERR